MSAVPKKKLCWNCEGNVSKEIDNCPYCGVYLHANELEENSSWGAPYRSSSKEENPSSLYQIQPLESPEEAESTIKKDKDQSEYSLDGFALFHQLKRDIFPLLFLMMGSVFFLFGVVLLLFAQNGTLTLQWQGKDGFYFLLFAFPLLGLGWKFLQSLETTD